MLRSMLGYLLKAFFLIKYTFNLFVALVKELEVTFEYVFAQVVVAFIDRFVDA